MPDKKNTMQALFIDPNHLDQEFKIYGYDIKFINEWQQQYNWKPLKLRAIPNNLKSFISGFFSDVRGSSTVLGPSDGDGNIWDLLILAPEKSYLDFINSITTDNGQKQEHI